MEVNRVELLENYKKYFKDLEEVEDFLDKPYIVDDPNDFADYYPEESTPNLFIKENEKVIFTIYKIDLDTYSMSIKENI